MLERKGLVNRLIAAIIDNIVGMVAMVVLSMLGIVGVILGAAVLCAFPFLEIMLGQTPGKMALKMRITAEDGSTPSQQQRVRRALIRWSPNLATAAIMLISIVVPFFGLLSQFVIVAGCIALLVLSLKTIQTTKQAFWDVQANTAVMGPQGVGVAEQPIIATGAATPAAPPQPGTPTQA